MKAVVLILPTVVLLRTQKHQQNRRIQQAAPTDPDLPPGNFKEVDKTKILIVIDHCCSPL